MSPNLIADDRAVMIPVAHVMTIAITSILIVGLLVGASGLLDSQQETATREELRTVGNRLSTDLARVDALAQQGGSATVTTRHASKIAGNRYTVSLHRGSTCDTNRITADTCLEVESVGLDVTQYVPLDNESELSIESETAGVFTLSAVAASSTTETVTWDRLDLSTRVGVGRDVRPSGATVSATPGNQPPIAKFSFTPGSPQAGKTVHFDASRSRDPDGSIDQFLWDFDGDGNYEEDTANPTIDRQFAPGSYNVSLRVKDKDGASSNFTKFIDVSGLIYNDDLDVDTDDDTVAFSVQNNFARDVEITHLLVDPRDDTIDELDNGDDDEVQIDATNDGYHDEYGAIYLPDGGRIIHLENHATVDAYDEATITLREFSGSVDGKRLDLGVQYTIGSVPNSTTFTDVVGGPRLSNYGLVASGSDVDLTFDSTKPLDTVTVELGGDVGGTIDRSDLSETSIAGGYRYSYDVSSGSQGFFWANITVAENNGVSSGEVPINDTIVTSTGPMSWTTAADWDGYSTAAGIVHANYGTHEDDRLELGYPTFDRGGSNLSGFWSLDDDTTATDESGNGNDGTVNGGVGTALGLFGTDAYDFDGTDDHVEIPHSSSLEMADTDAVTVSAWVNKDEAQGGWTALFQHSDRSYNLQLNDDYPEFTVYDGDWYTAAGSSQLSSDDWYHLVGVFDGDETELYIDGSYVDGTPDADEIDSASHPIGIGENLETGGRNFDGQIDEVRVYDRALTSGEISRLYSAHSKGTLTTGWKVGPNSIDGGDVELQYYASVDTGETVRVRVHSRNGTVDESNWVTLGDGSGSVDVPGLSQAAAEYRLEVELTTNAAGHAPSVSSLEVVDGS